MAPVPPDFKKPPVKTIDLTPPSGVQLRAISVTITPHKENKETEITIGTCEDDVTRTLPFRIRDLPPDTILQLTAAGEKIGQFTAKEAMDAEKAAIPDAIKSYMEESLRNPGQTTFQKHAAMEQALHKALIKGLNDGRKKAIEDIQKEQQNNPGKAPETPAAQLPGIPRLIKTARII